MFGRIKIEPADRLFSQFIRKRDKWRCVRCGRQHEEGSATLGCSHYWGRVHRSTRFDPDNWDSLCNLPCHRLWEGEERDEYMRFMIKKLGGENEFKILKFKAHTYKRKDKKLEELYIKEFLKSL